MYYIQILPIYLMQNQGFEKSCPGNLKSTFYNTQQGASSKYKNFVFQ